MHLCFTCVIGAQAVAVLLVPPQKLAVLPVSGNRGEVLLGTSYVIFLDVSEPPAKRKKDI